MIQAKHDLQASNRRMTELLNQLATGQGARPSILDGVKLMRANCSVPRSPVFYEPSIVIVGQGRKRGFLGDKVIVYDAHNYLVLGLPMPFECETEVGDAGPLLGVSIRVDLAVVSDLLMKMESKPIASDAHASHGMSSTPLDLPISEATVRLLECMACPIEAQILGPQIMREITYRVLRGARGDSLRALIAVNGKLNQIQRVLERIHTGYAKPIDVADLAAHVGMSVSTFHNNFKAVTTTSPLQYIKTIRLHKARMQMATEGVNAATAAYKVGYQSPSQFSREFKRFFNATPQEETHRLRGMLGLETDQTVRVH